VTLSGDTEEFVGRRWALERVQHWWQNTADPVLVITGGPGVGKTSLVKEWVGTVCRPPSSGAGRAIHAVEYADARTTSGYPTGLLEALSSQLANSVEPYLEFLRRQSRIEQNIRIAQKGFRYITGNVTGIQIQVQVGDRFRRANFDLLMQTPFEKLHREGRLPSGGVTVVIDGLDEVATDPDDELSFAEALAQARPAPGLRLLLTARTATANSSLQRFPSFDLVSDEPPASSDLADFVAGQLDRIPEPLRGRLIITIVEYCAGWFGLARAWTDHINTGYGDTSAELMEPPPAVIAEGWQPLLNKLGSSASVCRHRYLPVLRIAALARGDGLPPEVLRAAVSRHSPGLQQQISTILDELQDFFRYSDRPDAPHRLCHVSLEKYLTGPPEHSAENDFPVSQSHLAIATVLAERTRWNGSDHDVASYAQQHLLTHLVAAVLADRTAVQQVSQRLLEQTEFIETAMRRNGVERFQWELERLAVAFDHQVVAVNNLAFLLGRQVAQLRNLPSETDAGFLLRQLLHAARACGAENNATDYRRGLRARSTEGLETVWATGGEELASSVREFKHGHAPVDAVAMVDESRFVTTSDDGSASIWDVQSGRRRRLPGDGSRIRALAASSGWALTGSGRGVIQVWDMQTTTLRPPPARLFGPVVALAILPDGERGVSLSTDGLVRVWRLGDGHELDVIERPKRDPVASEAYRPMIMAVTAERVLTASATGCIVVTDLPDTSQQLVLWHPGDELTTAALSLDGRYVVSGGVDGGVVLWNLTEKRRPYLLPDEEPSRALLTDSAEIQQVDSQVTALLISKDGRFVVAGSGVGARLWDTETDAGDRLGGASGISALLLVPGDRQVITASLDHRLRLWSLESQKLLHLFPGHRDRVRSVALDPSGRRMVSVSYDGTARLWHIPAAAESTILQSHPARPTAMSWTADGTGVVVTDAAGWIWRRNLADGQGEQPDRACTKRVTALIPAAKGARAMVGTSDGTAGVWNVETAAFEKESEPGSVRVTALVAVSDEWAVATHADGLARLWHRRTAESLHVIRHSRGFTAAAVTRLGNAPAVLLAADDHTVRLWSVDAQTWHWEHADHEMTVTSIAVCEDNSYAITAALDGTVRRWQITDGMSREFDTTHQAEATTVATGSGMLAVSGARDGSAIVWDLRDCTARHHLDHGPTVDAVTAVAFTPSGRYVLTGASDGGVRLWRVSMAGPRLTRPRLRLMLDAAVTHLLVAPTGDLAVVATATGQLTCVQLP